MDVKQFLPTEWDMPELLAQVNLPVSDNPTINFLDAVKRKANILNDEFRGKRQPEYMRYATASKLPSITKKSETGVFKS